MFILQFLLFMFFVVFVVFAFIIWRAWRKIHNTVNQFNSQFGSGAYQNEDVSPHRSTTTDSGETIIDMRSQEKANQKIFRKDEGEYVDYEEKE